MRRELDQAQQTAINVALPRPNRHLLAERYCLGSVRISRRIISTVFRSSQQHCRSHCCLRNSLRFSAVSFPSLSTYIYWHTYRGAGWSQRTKQQQPERLDQEKRGGPGLPGTAEIDQGFLCPVDNAWTPVFARVCGFTRSLLCTSSYSRRSALRTNPFWWLGHGHDAPNTKCRIQPNPIQFRPDG